jgi:hypothetical protein
MKVSGELHALATLTPGKEPLVRIGYEAGWAPEPFWTRWWREKFPVPAGKKIKMVLCITKHHVMKRILCLNHAIMTSGSGGTAPRIFKLSTRWKWVFSFTAQTLGPLGRTARFMLDTRLGERGAEVGRKKNFPAPNRNQTSVVQPISLSLYWTTPIHFNISRRRHHHHTHARARVVCERTRVCSFGGQNYLAFQFVSIRTYRNPPYNVVAKQINQEIQKQI